MIVLDTSAISEIFRPQPQASVMAWLDSLSGAVAITTITLAELLAGVRRLPDGRRKAALGVALDSALEPYLGTRSLLAFDAEAAAQYAEVLVAREAAGLPISTADAQIAAICRANEATCATRNESDFAKTGIEVLNQWTL